MNLPDFDDLRPGVRLLLTVRPENAIPDDIAGPLIDHGRACNDLATALAAALLDKDRLIDQEQRASYDSGKNVEGQTIQALFDINHECIEQLSALYADTAAQYAVDAIEAAGQAHRRQPLTPSAPRPITATDLILLPEIHLPLIQIDVSTIAKPKLQHRAQVENRGIVEGHRLLHAAIAEARKPENQKSGPTPAERCVLEPELGAALHNYAAACIEALTILTSRG
ncbi:MAG: hypothetical protein QOI01_4046 [Mycobacterium sp.]|jgi:hypothetical protein|nr:hypothetical protein [Mycobacterium sp.]